MILLNPRIIAAAAGMLAAVAAYAAPAVRWIDTRHNFGAFHEDDGTVECVFRYVNTGDEPLRITAARTSCGCTLPHYDRDDVMPGDTAQVTVSYDPTGRPGRFSKNVYIELNVEQPRTTLTISGVVIGAPTTLAQRYPVAFSPSLRASRGAIMAGEVAQGHMKSVFLEFYNASTDTLRPQVASAPPFADAAWMPEAIAPGEQSSLVCHVRTADIGEWGLVEDSLTIKPSPASDERVVLPLTVIVSEDFSKLTPAQMAKAPIAEPESDRVDFAIVERSAGTISKTVKLTNRGRSPLEIRRVYSADSGISARADRQRIKPGKSAEITIDVDPSAIKGSILNSKIVVICNDPVRPNLALRAVGELR